MSPNTTPLDLGAASSIGSVEGLFPCGALVNHCCHPNSFFHCVASPSADGPPVIEQVLRTIDRVRAGQELCYSYLSDAAARTAVSVSNIHGLYTRQAFEGYTTTCDPRRPVFFVFVPE